MATKESAFSGQDPLSWLKSRVSNEEPTGANSSPEEPMLPDEKVELDDLLSDLEDTKSAAEEDSDPKAATLDDLKAAIEQATAPSQERIDALAAQMQSVVETLGQLKEFIGRDISDLGLVFQEQRKAAEVQRDFAGAVQANMTSHHTETSGALENVAKALNDGHDQLARQGNATMNAIAAGLAAQTTAIRKSVVKTVWGAAAATTFGVLLAGIFVIGPIMRDATSTLVRETMGARTTVEERIKQLKAPEETEESIPSKLGEEEKQTEPSGVVPGSTPEKPKATKEPEKAQPAEKPGLKKAPQFKGL